MVPTQSHNVKSENKPKIKAPIVISQFLQTRGLGLHGDSVDSTSSIKTESSIETLGPISMSDARQGTHSDDASFVQSLIAIAQKEAQAPPTKLASTKGGTFFNDASVKEGKVESSLRLEYLYLDPQNVAWVVPAEG
ncbi:hypothetical protein Fmac_012931 [Flemingia macrophylla]|uniref:Uncharacterized protein n=1 Tax=Flemingia macrophylla TaxID=520843 RepID=A0ABD1MRQ1_9FABA